jgi:predicted transcriptional regulator YdeE
MSYFSGLTFLRIRPTILSSHPSQRKRQIKIKYQATIVNQLDIELVVCRADEFPAGIKESWERLESKLASLKGRKFYGLTFWEDDHLVYYAGLQPADEAEIRDLGFPTMTLKGGKYARVKLTDWNNHTNEIVAIFDQLMKEYKKDPSGPTVEFYRSHTELHLMIPLVQN